MPRRVIKSRYFARDALNIHKNDNIVESDNAFIIAALGALLNLTPNGCLTL